MIHKIMKTIHKVHYAAITKPEQQENTIKEKS